MSMPNPRESPITSLKRISYAMGVMCHIPFENCVKRPPHAQQMRMMV